MDNPTAYLSNSIDRYFHTLSNIGYINDSTIEKLIVFAFADDIINGIFGEVISEKDYMTINNSLYCLYNTSCLLPYPQYYEEVTLPLHNKFSRFRITEINDLYRSTEDNIIRKI